MLFWRKPQNSSTRTLLLIKLQIFDFNCLVLLFHVLPSSKIFCMALMWLWVRFSLEGIQSYETYFVISGGSPIILEYTGVTHLPPPSSPSPPPHATSLQNITVSWGSEDVKMISMELGPPQHGHGHIQNSMVMGADPSYSPHDESIGSDQDHGHDHHDGSEQDQMQHDSKRKREYTRDIFLNSHHLWIFHQST